jgi:hypothetical protein
MNPLKLIRFFIFGPGAILTVIGVVIGVAGIIHQGQEKQKAEAEKRQIQRPLGQVKPSATVDKSTAPKEVILSDKRLIPGKTSERPASPQTQTVSLPGAQTPRSLPSLVSFYAQVPMPTPSTTPVPEPVQKAAQAWLPPGTFIPCALVNTVESSHINTPVVGEVLRDVYQNGHLIIPAGAVASSFAESGAVRDRIEVAGVWLIVYPDGRYLRIHGIACDREADSSNQQFGVEDGSAGLQGELVESDHWANAKAFIALLMTASMQTGTAIATSTLQASHTTGVTTLPDTTPILAKYLDQLLNGETGDGRFVRVRASKEFYVFATETVLPGNRTVSEQKSPEDELSQGANPQSKPLDAVQAATQLEKEIINASQQPNSENKNGGENRFHY